MTARLGKWLGIVCLLGTPFIVHASLVTQRGMGLAGSLIAAQAALVGWAMMSLAAASAIRRKPRSWLAIRLAVCAGLFGLTLAIWLRVKTGLALAEAVPHATAYLGMLTLFAASLAPGREAIITTVARRARGTLSDELLRYTRAVTILWCGFFIAQLAASLLLWLFAPLVWWSAFVNLGTVPLVLLMFGAELAYRHWRHGIFVPAGPAGSHRAVRVLRQIRIPVGRAEP
jgi:uncharacterized membrane protein